MTKPWWDDCCVWIEAERCQGQGAFTGGVAPCKDGLRVFVHEDNVTEDELIFNYGSIDSSAYNCCWKVRADQKRVVLPHKKDGETIETFKPTTIYDSCGDCSGDIDEPAEGGGVGGGGSGGAGGGWGPNPGGGGGAGAGPAGPAEPPMGVHLTRAQLCDGHDQIEGLAGIDWWISEASLPGLDDGEIHVYIIRVNGLCFEINTGQLEKLPAGADVKWLDVAANEYTECSDCTDGIKAEFCSEDEKKLEGAEDQPDYYMRRGDAEKIPNESRPTLVFERNGFCYKFEVGVNLDDAEWSLIPPPSKEQDVVILPVLTSLGDCGDCALGLKAMPCEQEEDDPPEYWVAKDDLVKPEDLVEEQDRTYWKIDGRCYSVPVYDDSLPFERIPAGVEETQTPWDAYLNCESCFCDEPKPAAGYKAYLCWQPDDRIDPANDVWVLASSFLGGTLPEDGVVFLYGETCYYIPEDEEKQRVPDSARIANPRIQYRNCQDCASRGGMDDPEPPGFPPPGGGGAGGGFGGFPFPPFPPFMMAGVIPCDKDTSDPANIEAWTDPFLYTPTTYKSLQLGHLFFNKCVRVTWFLEDEKTIQARGEPVVSFPTGTAQRFLCCGTCLDHSEVVWQINRCYGSLADLNGGTQKYLVTNDLSAYEGKVLKIDADGSELCWRVQAPICFEPKITIPPFAVTVTDYGPDNQGWDNCAHCEGWYKLAQCGGGRLFYTNDTRFEIKPGGKPYSCRIDGFKLGPAEKDDYSGCYLVSRADPPPEGGGTTVPGTAKVEPYPLGPEGDYCYPCRSASSSSSSSLGGMAGLMGGGIGTGLV
ncbi:MAG: hypothetical protein AAGI37_09920 [Planctomycetota bacterium]